MNIYVYDFDGTIYDGDSSIDFYRFCLRKKITIIKYLPKQIWYVLLYKLKRKSKRQMKEIFFIFLKSFSNIEFVIEEFWVKHEAKIKPWYLQKNHENDIIISASPSFLLEIPCHKLKVKDLIATEVDKKSGKFLSENCYGGEKVKRLHEKYKNIIVEEMYTDSLADQPMLELANKGFIVHKNEIKLWK